MPRPRKADEALKYASVVKEMSGNGISQRRIAESLKISQSTVSRLLATAPKTGADRLAEKIASRAGYSDLAQSRHDAYHDGDTQLVTKLTAELAAIDTVDGFPGHKWSPVSESDELCKFFFH